MQQATILLAHGSSDPHWLAPFDSLLDRIRQQLSGDTQCVQLAYMELAEPTIEQQVEHLRGLGAQHIHIRPLFFAAGRHLRKDVPAMLEDLQQALAERGHHITLELHNPIGLEPEVADAITHVVTRQLAD